MIQQTQNIWTQNRKLVFINQNNEKILSSLIWLNRLNI